MSIWNLLDYNNEYLTKRLKKEQHKLDELKIIEEKKYQEEKDKFKEQIKLAQPIELLKPVKKKYKERRYGNKKYYAYIDRANRKQIPFDLTVDQFNNLLNNSCAYCGSRDKITIDREDSKLGYTIHNSKSCCFKCNIAKYTYSKDDFLNHIKRIYEFNYITK